jgi:Fe-S cluster assembly iron-binding protein IscA
LVQGESTEKDIVINVDDMKFAVEGYYQKLFNKFKIDYSVGFFRKGFVVYPNGQRSGC